MRPQLVAALAAAAPALYRYAGWDDPRRSLLGFGVACDDGWFPILMALTRRLERLRSEHGLVLRVLQVKEKMGRLRVYVDVRGSDGDRQRVERVVAEAEARSARTCEHCGRPGSPRERLRDGQPTWFRTLCPACAGLWTETQAWDPWRHPPRLLTAPPAEGEEPDPLPPQDAILAALEPDPARSPVWWLALDRARRWWWAAVSPSGATVGIWRPAPQVAFMAFAADRPVPSALQWARQALPAALGCASLRAAAEAGQVLRLADDLCWLPEVGPFR